MKSMFENTKVGTRLGAGFGLLLLLILAMAGLSQYTQLTVANVTDRITQKDFTKLHILNEILQTNLEGVSDIGKMLLLTDQDEIKRIAQFRSTTGARMNDLYKQLDSLIHAADGKAILADLMEARKVYTPIRLKTIELLGNGKRDEALKKWSTEGALAYEVNRKLIQKLLDRQKKLVEDGASEITATNRSASILIYAMAALALLLGLGISLLITRSLRRQLGGEPSVAAGIANRMAAGDLSMKIDIAKGDNSSLMACMQTMQSSVQALIADVAMLSEAAVQGKLETRADAMKHEGDFRRVVGGVNDTLDAVIGPLNMAASYVDQISKGAIPAKITDSYNGDFNALKNNLNVCIDAVNSLVADANMLSAAAVDGKLATRADAARHHGDFRKIVQGVNDTLDAIVGPVNEVVRVLGALSQGDLTERISTQYKGTFDQLKSDSNLTVDKLTEIVGQIKEATESIKLASKEIASGNSDLSSRTEQQASSLEETASSMEELTSTVKQNAENARQANQLAASASEVAVKGGDVVGQVVTTMSSINESSKKIVDIISVIDGIAFQTNILALNAAVEAARAGEQGRGFAVVATEVRTLAQRSAAAAKEIKELIGDSVEKVGAGTKLVDEAGSTMQEIVNSVKRVTDIMAEITAASQEQSAGIEQVNQAITQMDEVTQQNAALVEEAAAAAESMEEQAGNLASAVAIFKLTQAGRPTQARPAAARPTALPSPHKPATVTKHPSARIKAAKASGGDGEWTEF